MASASSESLVGQGRQRDEPAEGMGLLAVERAFMLDRAVTSPVADGGQRIMSDPLGHRPDERTTGCGVVIQGRPQVGTGQSDRPMARPMVTKCVWPRNRMSQTCERVPELVEGRIEVEIDPTGNAAGEFLVDQHARNIDQHIGGASDSLELLIRKANGLPRPRDQEGGVRIEPERLPSPGGSNLRCVCDPEELLSDSTMSPGMLSTKITRCPSRRNPSRYWSTAQVAPPWSGIGGDHSAQEDGEPIGHVTSHSRECLLEH